MSWRGYKFHKTSQPWCMVCIYKHMPIYVFVKLCSCCVCDCECECMHIFNFLWICLAELIISLCLMTYDHRVHWIHENDYQKIDLWKVSFCYIDNIRTKCSFCKNITRKLFKIPFRFFVHMSQLIGIKFVFDDLWPQRSFDTRKW